MRKLLGPEAEALFAALQANPVTGLRVNTLKLSSKRFAEISPWPLKPVPWCPAGFVLSTDAQAGKHPFHAVGLYYLQEPSAMAVAEALAPQAGELVLDLAAAPGGKAGHLSALMNNQSVIVANEVNRARARALTQNLERLGVRKAVITNEKPRRLARAWGAIFDRVLLDAPCSGEGLFRKSADALEMWSENNVLACAKRQDSLLDEAAALLRPGGVLVYSTCTFAPEENEQVIAAFLDRHPDFVLQSIDLAGVAPGRPDWLAAGVQKPALTKTVRLWPQLIAGEGHFIAKLQHRGEPDANIRPELSNNGFKPVSGQLKTLWQRLVKTTLSADPAQGRQLTTFGEQLYALPKTPHLSGLRTMRAGLWLATIKKDRLIPSHSLALALKANEIDREKTLELSPNDPRLKQYLQGHPLDDKGEDGWLLITVAGFPIGWGRRAKSIIKNAYPKGLRLA